MPRRARAASVLLDRARGMGMDLASEDERVGQGEAARWLAIDARDAAADGRFVYSVRSTGVYCRPSCPSRAARRDNVAFHATCAAAEAAGFRPCQRCRPNEASRAERQVELVSRACTRIAAADEPPALAALAKAAGLSASRFHRVFKAATGVTPRAYAAAGRAERVAASLRAGAPVTRAAYDAGFNSASRFYAAAPARLGMSPAAYRDGGAGAAIHYALGRCSFGAILVAATTKGICAILLGEDFGALTQDLATRFPKAAITGADPAFAATVARVVAFVEAPVGGLDLPLDIGGTAFQQRVWAALRDVAAGDTTTYAAVARAIGQPAAVRAVAGACAANAHAVAIPCHRVLRGDGSLSGYRWGVERKRALLAREREGDKA